MAYNGQGDDFFTFFEEVEMSNRILFSLLALLTVLILVSESFYQDMKKENRALRLQVQLLSKEKRTPKPWRDIVRPVRSAINESGIGIPQKVGKASDDDNLVAAPDLSTKDLALKLTGELHQLDKIKKSDLAELINISDEVIEREPDSYSAYKAKLLLLLYKEAKYGELANESDIEQLLETMASFEFDNNQELQKEAFLIAKTNREMEELNQLFETIDETLDALDDEMIESEGDLQALRNLEIEKSLLLDKASELNEKVALLEEDAFLPEDSANEDIVHIPFLRLLAQKDFDNAIEQAEVFIEDFPRSVIGYYYLIKALQLSGDEDSSLSVIESIPLEDKQLNKLREMLESSDRVPPGEYWRRLKF